VPELFSNSIFLLIANLAILAVMITVTLFILSRFRSYSVQKEQSELSLEKHLDYFQELKTQGKLSAEEYRLIKKRLSVRIAEGQRRTDDFFAAVSASGFDPAVILDRLARERQDNDTGTDAGINKEEPQFIRNDGEDTVIEKKN
jgi:hypothetical protein